MTSSTIVVGVAVAYLALSLVVGLLPGRNVSSTAVGYVAGDRSLGLLVMYFITGATVFSAFAFMGAPGWVYSKGAAAFYILGYGALGFVPFYFFAPRAARLGRHYGFVTQAEMVAKRYNLPAIALVMAVVSIVAFVPYLALQIQGAGMVLEAVTRGSLPAWAGGGIVYGVVLIYVLRSGVLGVGWTNTFQGIFMLALAWGLGLYLPHKLYGGVGPMFERLAVERPDMLLVPGPKWTWGEFSAAIIVSSVGFSVWPHLFMKAFTAKDERTLRRTVVLYPTFQLFLVPLFLIGFAGILFSSPPARADQILPHMLMNLELPALLVGLFCAGALAASMSSGDAMVHAAASIAVRDGWIGALGNKVEDGTQTRLIRWVVVAVMVLSYATALISMKFGISLVMLLLSAYGAVVQFAPTVFCTLYVRRAGGKAVLAGLLAGAAVTLLFVVFKQWQPVKLHAGLYGLVANVATICAVTGWSEEPEAKASGADGDASEFLDVAAGK